MSVVNNVTNCLLSMLAVDFGVENYFYLKGANLTSIFCMFRGDPFITLAPRGEGGLKKWPIFAKESTDRLSEMANKGRGGLKSLKVCRRNKWMGCRQMADGIW